jgi:DNA polymerase-1
VPRTTDKPWNGDAHSAFHSGRDGFTLIGWDYGQLELRFAAAYGRETLLLAEFEKDDADPFSVLAPQIFGVLTPETRHDTKNKLVYPSLYGAGLRKVALGLGKPISEAAPIYERYKATIPGITRVSEQVRELVKRRGWVRYWDGRVRHIRNPNDVHTRAWNSVLQGGSAQLVKRVMLRLEAEVEDENCFMVLQVHDEVAFCIKHVMTDWPQFQVRLTVSGKEWK